MVLESLRLDWTRTYDLHLGLCLAPYYWGHASPDYIVSFAALDLRRDFVLADRYKSTYAGRFGDYGPTARRPHILLDPEGSETAINSKQGDI